MTNREWLRSLSDKELEEWLCDEMYDDEYEHDCMFDEPRAEKRDIIYLRDFPSADVVEVVRCKDCKYHLFDGSCDNDYISRQIEHCGCYPDFNTPDDFFCKYGERKET